jgi:hypothetical protein
MAKTTIVDACVSALDRAERPLSAAEMFEMINEHGLYEFKAKDPFGVMRSSLNKHIRKSSAPKLVVDSSGRYRRP